MGVGAVNPPLLLGSKLCLRNLQRSLSCGFPAAAVASASRKVTIRGRPPHFLFPPRDTRRAAGADPLLCSRLPRQGHRKPSFSRVRPAPQGSVHGALFLRGHRARSFRSSDFFHWRQQALP